MTRVIITIPGAPISKGRPRFGNGRTYTPKATADYEDLVRMIAKPHFPSMIAGPVCLDIRAAFEPPKSLTKREREARMWRAHTQRPDLDNLIKIICDGLNGIAWNDDAQVYAVTARKLWGSPAQVVVAVEPVG